MRFTLALAWLLIINSSDVLAFASQSGTLTSQAEARLDADYAMKRQRLSLLRPAISAELRGRNLGDHPAPHRFALAVRLRQWRHEQSDVPTVVTSEMDIRELSGEWQGDQSTLTLGVQEVVWGETIGLPVVDLVHPRDYREPIYRDPAESRLPAALARIDLQLLQALNLQILATPIPPPPRVRERIGDTPVSPPQTSQSLAAAEYGSRLGWLFASGLDVKFYALHHHNRNEVYQPILEGSTPSLRLVQEAMNTMGMGFSYSSHAIVWRGDAARHIGQPYESLGSIRHGSLLRAALGFDWTGPDELLIACQISQDRYDHDFQPAVGRTQLSWGAVKVSAPLLSRVITLEALSMHGLGHTDRWLQPRLVFTTRRGFSAELRADLLAGESPGYFHPYRDDDQFRFSLRYRF